MQTAKCPAALDLAFERPSVYEDVPTHRDERELTDGERENLSEVMQEARAMGPFRVSIALREKKNGRCVYGTESGVARVWEGVLATTHGQNVLKLSHGDWRIEAHPTAYAPIGLSFAPEAQAALYANIETSASFGEGQTMNIAIGEVPFATR